MGRSEYLLRGYLAQKWFFSITNKDTKSRFLAICKVLREHSYEEIKQLTKKQLECDKKLKDSYIQKLKILKQSINVFFILLAYLY